MTFTHVGKVEGNPRSLFVFYMRIPMRIINGGIDVTRILDIQASIKMYINLTENYAIYAPPEENINPLSKIISSSVSDIGGSGVGLVTEEGLRSFHYLQNRRQKTS